MSQDSDRIETVIAEALNDEFPGLAAYSGVIRAKSILAALKAARIAVVELPKPAYGPDGEGQFGWRPDVSTVTATPNEDGSWSIWDEDFNMSPDDAYELGATLLAAAAEADQ